MIVLYYILNWLKYVYFIVLMYQSVVEEAVAEAEASGMDASAKAASIKDIDSKLEN